MQTWEYIWEILINLLESSLLVFFLEDKLVHSNRIYEKHATSLKIVFVIADTLRTSFFNFIVIPFEICYLFSFFIFGALAILFYEDSLSKKIFFSCLYLTIIFVSDTIASAIPQVVFHTKLTAVLIGGPLRIPITLLYISCISGFVFISHFIKWNIISMSPIETVIFIVVCILGLFFGQYIVSITIDSVKLFHNIDFSNKLILVATIYCFLYILLMAYIYILNITKEQNRKLVEDKQQLLLEEADYKGLIERTASLRELKHDMQHHLTTIQYLSQHNLKDELDDFINKYIGSLEDMHKFVSSGNSAIDCILSTNIPKAEQLGIKVSSVITVPDTFKLDPILTASLLGNLWTNSITACKKLIDTHSPINPFIDFYIKPHENMLIISMENSFDGIIKKDSIGQYLSTKSNTYGIGLRRINEIIEQNDGIINISNNDNIFCVHVMFPLREKDIYENCNS